jgi:ectoine hydroxylase-related dioxygenase (phytanoyl-CoA dioxygenase family)
MKHDPERWKRDFERGGYLVVEGVLDSATLARLREATERICNNRDSLPPHLREHVRLETEFLKRQPHAFDLPAEKLGNAVKSIMELPLFDPVFAELICFQPQLDILETMLGTTEFAFYNYKATIKSARVSSRVVWHRDLPFLEHSTPDLITCMLCLDDMTEASGATVVLPGTHRIPHEQILQSDTDIPEEQLPRDAPRQMICCPAGSAVLFHVNIIHGGPANRSENPRRNIISIWSGSDAFPIKAWRGAYHGLMPRSKNVARQRQLRMAFPRLFSEKTELVASTTAVDAYTY